MPTPVWKEGYVPLEKGELVVLIWRWGQPNKTEVDAVSVSSDELLHHPCGGRLIVKPVEKNKELSCQKCGFWTVFPEEIKTLGELKSFLAKES
ncbi:MAG: hypothetical protein HZC04_00815 [Candidatus Lloydbacteria bacterium]|nr:hypothetical protein [Candidatus Lloydbacteria bacterium]